ncbi:hypothetical protein [Pseudoxanthomonas japonensis]|uniref:hypothetical protein n=1 Tax=Pseudoxanthomonas japonensis TaxID=69284 RepID=UPI0020BEFB53|nr:hypothetical protein [Pseudoxanthomonas japonensis]
MDLLTVAMSVLYLVLALLSAIAFYLGSPHQRLWSGGARYRRGLRISGWITAMLALVAGVIALGVWAGAFSALTAWMFGTVLLPYADVWCHARKEDRHVG